MSRTSLKGLDPFLLAVAFLSLLTTALALSPSSYGIVLRNLGAPDDGVRFGEPRAIRSDEYALWTPMLQAAEAGGYGQINESSIYRESQRHLYALPLRDWGLAFKPTLWPFLVLPAPYAYAAYFAACSFLFLAGYYLLGRQFGSPAHQAILIALLLYYSAYTQAWWTSLGHHLAVFPWLLLLYLAELRPAARAAAVTLATAGWFLAGTFYPPLVWTLFLAGLLGLWVFRPEMASAAPALRSRQLAMLAGLLLGSLIAYFYLREPLAAALASSGHGQRNEMGGRVPWQDFLGLFFPLLSYKGSIVISGTNQCEASAAGSTLWPLLLFFLDYRASAQNLREQPDAGALKRRLGALALAFLLHAAWMLLPLPAWLGAPLLWNRFPNSRLLFTAGLLSLWLSLLVLRFARFRCSLPRLALFCAAIAAAWWPSRIPASFEWLLGRHWLAVLRLEWRDHANNDLLPAVLALALAAIAWLLRRRLAPERWLRPTAALALAAGCNAVFFFDFNPLMSTRPIFERPATAHTEKLRQLQEAHPQRWLVIGGWEHLGRSLNGWGFRAVNHGFIVPETRLLRERFPDLPQHDFDYVFNRYCLVQVALYRPGGQGERLRQPFFRGGDLALMPAEAFLPETPIALSESPPPTGLAPKGRLRRLRLEGKKLELSFEGDINGTSGQSAITLHLAGQGKIVDRWLRPRGDDWKAALEDGLRLFSRVDLEIELENPPAKPADLRLCLVTSDPAFGTFSIPLEGQASSLCPP